MKVLKYIVVFNLFCITNISAQAPYQTDKEQKIYHDITLKIEKLENERLEKISEIKKKRYPLGTETRYLNHLNQRIDRAIQEYKKKGNYYFRKVGKPEPWEILTKKKEPQQTVSQSQKRSDIKANAINSDNNPKSFIIDEVKNIEEHISNDNLKIKSMLSKQDSTTAEKILHKKSQSKNGKPRNGGTDGVSSATDLTKYKDENRIRNNNNSYKKAVTDPATSTSINKVFALILISLAILMILVVFKNRARIRLIKKLKIIFIAVIIFFIGIVIISLNKNQNATDSYKAHKPLSPEIIKKANNYQDTGALLFSQSFVDDDRDMLIESIVQLEKAFTLDPSNKAIVVDLADAYMQLNTIEQTAIAIELYESLLDSYSNDPILARIIAGYYQIQNFDVALYLASQRLKYCPNKMRRAASLQMSYIAISAGKEKMAINALYDNLKKRGKDPVLNLIIAILEQSRGEINKAISILNNLEKDNSSDYNFISYVKKMRREMNYE